MLYDTLMENPQGVQDWLLQQANPLNAALALGSLLLCLLLWVVLGNLGLAAVVYRLDNSSAVSRRILEISTGVVENK